MFRSIRRAFRTLTPKEMAEIELQEARKALLESQSGMEYAQAMVRYNEARVARLEKLVEGQR